MKTSPLRFVRRISASLVLALGWSAANSADNAPVAASELAARLGALQQRGAAYVRLRMEINGTTKETLQLQIKERRSKDATEVVYQVLYPKQRKGESVLLRKIGDRPATGTVFVPPNTVRTVDDMKQPLLGSDLSYEDIVENFFTWDQQTIIGTEAVDGVNCVILESKPGTTGRSSYGSVRSWIDTRRMVPLRVEKFGNSGRLLRRIETTRVVSDEGHHIPANLTVRGTRPNSSTDLDGSRLRRDVNHVDADFTVEGIQTLAAPR